MKINNIDTLLSILNNNFFNFLNKEKWIIQKQSFNFNYIDEDIDEDIKSMLKLKHIDYKIILPHEAINNELNLDEFIAKYNKRIIRFNKIIKSSKQKIFYIGLDEINEINKDKIISCLNNYGCINYHIKFIEYDKFKLIDEFSWQRNWIPWDVFFI
jgi:hypothetical protein